MDSSGVSEAEITSQGNNIIVSLPGHPSEETLKLVRTSAQMEFRPVLVQGAPTPTSDQPSPSSTIPANGVDAAAPDPTPTADAANPSDEPTKAAPDSPSDAAYYVTPKVQADYDALDCTNPDNRKGGAPGDPDKAFVTCSQDGSSKFILGPVEIEGARISGASSGLKQLQGGGTSNEWVVNITFDSKGTDQFTEVTTRLQGQTPPLNQFAMVLDGLVISAPSLQGRDHRRRQGGDLRDRSPVSQPPGLANQLNFGSLPISFEVKSESQISATLGSEQLQKGLLAGIIGLILVVIYSMLQYRALGLVTVSSLVVAATITYGVITLLSWLQGYRLSLPGVAGLIVAIGITADSFIVYFERIRDELREGRVLNAAVERGWDRARRTILASDAVNLMAAGVLFAFALGGVKGFAFTLGLTTIIDIVVVFMFTHPVMELISKTKFFSEGHTWSGLDPRRLGVPGARYAGRGRVVTVPAATDDVQDAPVVDHQGRYRVAGARDGWRSRPVGSHDRGAPSSCEEGRCRTDGCAGREHAAGVRARVRAHRGERALMAVGFAQWGNDLYTGRRSYNIVGRRRIWFTISTILVILSAIFLIKPGLNPGIEFRGGSEFVVSGVADKDQQLAIDTVQSVAPDEEPRVSTVGGDSLRIQTSTLDNAQVEEVKAALAEAYDVPVATNVTSSFIGPSWGKDVSQRAILGIVVFLLLVTVIMTVYFRNWRMALAALIALFHDLIITVGVYAAVGWEVTPATVIGFLTILGYSIYDTVVVFDKVRENTADTLEQSRWTYAEKANLAVNQTLVRSINTSVVALLPVAAILFVGVFILGAGTLRDIALALFIGMLIGTFSSIFLATPFEVVLRQREAAITAHTAKILAARKVAAGVTADGESGSEGPTYVPAGALKAGSHQGVAAQPKRRPTKK